MIPIYVASTSFIRIEAERNIFRISNEIKNKTDFYATPVTLSIPHHNHSNNIIIDSWIQRSGFIYSTHHSHIIISI